MNVQEFLRDVDSAAPAPVYLFCPFKNPRARAASFEPLLAERAVERLTSRYVDPTMRDLAYTVFYADETAPASVAMEAQTLAFLAERRVILVRNAERYDSEAAAGALLRYLDNPCDTSIVMFVASQIDKRTKFYKACEKAGVVVECPELRDREALAWIQAEVEGRGKRIETAATRELSARAGIRLSDVLNAINLVIDYVGAATTIREEDVVAACADVAEEVVWTLTDAISVSNTGDALKALHKLMDMGKVEDELMGTINWMLKMAYGVAKAGPRNAATFQEKKFVPLAEKLGVAKLIDAFALCTDTHFMFRTTGVDSALALELLVVKLAFAPKKRAAARA